MSPGGMALIAPVAGKPGERVIAYVDHLGRLEGKIARLIDNGFAMTISATARKRDKLAAQLTWLANRHILNLPEDRRHGRFTPRNPLARLILPNGSNVALPHHRPVAVGRGHRHRARPAAAGRRRGHPRQDAGPRGASYRRRLRDRIHPPAAPRLPRRQRHRRIAGAPHISLKRVRRRPRFRGPVRGRLCRVHALASATGKQVASNCRPQGGARGPISRPTRSAIDYRPRFARYRRRLPICQKPFADGLCARNADNFNQMYSFNF